MVDAARKAQVICVLGMHRSGTSLTAGILRMLGVYLGPDEQLLEPSVHNSKGYWENRNFMRMNNDILSRLGGEWHVIPTFPRGWESTPEFADLRLRARAFIHQEFAASGLWGWKDSRNCLTLSFWKRLLPSMQFVICMRNPVDVAQSLQHRDSFSLEKCVNLWLTYVTSALENTAGSPRLFVFYEDFMDQWQVELQRLARFLGKPELAHQQVIQQAVGEFIESSLQHHRTSVLDVTDGARLATFAKAFYLTLKTHAILEEEEKFRNPSDGSERLQQRLINFGHYCVKAQADLDQVVARMQQAEEQVRETEVLRQAVEARQTELTQTQAALAEAQGQVALREQVTEELRQTLAGRETELAQTQEALAEAQKRVAAREQAVEELCRTLAVRDTQLVQTQTSLAEAQARAASQEQAAQELRQMLTVREAELTRTQAVLADTQEQVALREQAVQELQGVLAARETELVQMQTSLIETQGKAASQEQAAQELRPALTAREGELQETKTRLSQAEQRIALWQGKAQAVAIELTSFRQRRVTRWLTRLQPGGDLRDEIAPAFQQLKDDSLLFTPNLKRFRLQPSRDLQHVPFLAYPLNLRRANLTGVLLAPILDCPASEGRLGIELVSPANTIVAQSVMPCSAIDEQVPARFVFPPIADSHQGRFWLRVFVRDVAGSVRLFEWRKYGLAGLGRLHTRAFCGFIFA